MKRFKRKGVTLAATAIAIVAWMFLGYIAFIVMASPFSVLAAARTARQAEQYAEFVASSLRLVDYDELDTAAHGRRSLAGEIADADDWESSVVLSDERQFGADAENVQRIATVDIFRTGDTLSRYTLQVPLSSASSGIGGEAIGTIVPRPSALFSSSSEASYYLYCDGSTFSAATYPKLFAVLGTTTLPDLRNRFLEGHDTPKTYKEAGLPNITAGVFINWATSVSQYGAAYIHSTTSSFLNNGVTNTYYYQHNTVFDASRCSNIYKNNFNTVQPPAYTVRYYIRAK